MTLTKAQEFVLAILQEEQDPMAGRKLRGLMTSGGYLMSSPGFYRMMSQLEDQGLVEGGYHSKMVDGVPIKERRYIITKKGTEEAV